MTPVGATEPCNACQLSRGHDGPCDWEGGREIVGRPRLVTRGMRKGRPRK